MQVITQALKMTAKTDPDKLEVAKNQYMQYVTITEISKEVNVPRATLHNWVRKSWKEDRTMRRSELYV